MWSIVTALYYGVTYILILYNNYTQLIWITNIWECAFVVEGFALLFGS